MGPELQLLSGDLEAAVRCKAILGTLVSHTTLGWPISLRCDRARQNHAGSERVSTTNNHHVVPHALLQAARPELRKEAWCYIGSREEVRSPPLGLTKPLEARLKP